MSRAHPLLNVDQVSDLTLAWHYTLSALLIGLGFSGTFEVRSEVLQQSYFLLKRCWVINDCVLFTDVLAIAGPPLDVVEVERVGVQHNFGRIVKEDTH